MEGFTLFWFQVAALVLINVLIFAMVFSRLLRARHSGVADGDYPV
ncbi:hypothetical protein [Saccharopolyspora soli]|nr:hypothetical protein [Saccharopolyspora soli]